MRCFVVTFEVAYIGFFRLSKQVFFRWGILGHLIPFRRRKGCCVELTRKLRPIEIMLGLILHLIFCDELSLFLEWRQSTLGLGLTK